MKNDQIYIEWIVKAYGHCIPWNKEITGDQLSEQIKSVYDISNPKNYCAFTAAKSLSGTFKNSFGSFSYTGILCNPTT